MCTTCTNEACCYSYQYRQDVADEQLAQQLFWDSEEAHLAAQLEALEYGQDNSLADSWAT